MFRQSDNIPKNVLFNDFVTYPENKQDALLPFMPDEGVQAFFAQASSNVEKLQQQLDEFAGIFQVQVGYPSKEKAIIGMHAYADGTIFKELNELKKMLAALSVGNGASQETKQETPAKNEVMDSVVELAKQYVEIETYCSRCERVAVKLKTALEERQAPEQSNAMKPGV